MPFELKVRKASSGLPCWAGMEPRMLFDEGSEDVAENRTFCPTLISQHARANTPSPRRQNTLRTSTRGMIHVHEPAVLLTH